MEAEYLGETLALQVLSDGGAEILEEIRNNI
jgi:hypothetical protein